MNRRAALGFLGRTAAQSAALAAVPVSAVAASGASDDAEIVALSADVVRLAAIGKEIDETRIFPLEERFHEVFHAARDRDQGFADACAYSAEAGRDAAIKDGEAVCERASAAFERMMDIPAKTNAGRAAKVRALLAHVVGDGWHGPGNELDWDCEMARALLGEFAGMSAEELAAV